MKIIMLSGVHGVGKGYLLKKLENNLKGYQVFTASELIGRYKCAADAGYKKVVNINNNQNVLMQALNELQKENVNNIILDGHICLFNARGIVERIPEEFFELVKISGIFLLQDEPKTILERLKDRDSIQMKFADIEEMQSAEVQYAQELQEKYSIEYKIIQQTCDEKLFEDLLNRMGGNECE